MREVEGRGIFRRGGKAAKNVHKTTVDLTLAIMISKYHSAMSVRL